MRRKNPNGEGWSGEVKAGIGKKEAARKDMLGTKEDMIKDV